MPETPRLALPLIAAGQAQKDVTHNEAVLALDRLVALAVASRSLPAPPASAPLGQCQIVPAAGAAAWGQPAGTLMHWQGSAWLPETPRDGQVVLVTDEAIMMVHRGGWQTLWPVAGLQIGARSVLSVSPAVVAPPSGGVTLDSEARSVISSLIQTLKLQGLLG